MMLLELLILLQLGLFNPMASKYTEGLNDIEGVTAKEIKLRSETIEEKKKRKKLQKLLEEASLGDASRDKRRFLKEEE